MFLIWRFVEFRGYLPAWTIPAFLSVSKDINWPESGFVHTFPDFFVGKNPFDYGTRIEKLQVRLTLLTECATMFLYKSWVSILFRFPRYFEVARVSRDVPWCPVVSRGFHHAEYPYKGEGENP